MRKPDLTVIILTYNEELHIKRAIESVQKIADTIWIVDSYSTDHTIAIAENLGARTIQNEFTNQAAQFLWAMSHCQINTRWIMRLDADEYLTLPLIGEIQDRLNQLPEGITGIILKRQVHFMGKWIRHGGYYPIELLRIWHKGAATIEQRWMDEHTILLNGTSVTFKHDFVDDNLNSLSWWISKHNDYATREAIEVLNRKHKFMTSVQLENSSNAQQSGNKRWYKENLYLKLPLFLRCFLYFQFRFWIKLGILDGQKGLVWHFLQGFWYRFLVDAKIMQIEWWAKTENRTIKEILYEKYKIKFDA